MFILFFDVMKLIIKKFMFNSLVLDGSKDTWDKAVELWIDVFNSSIGTFARLIEDDVFEIVLLDNGNNHLACFSVCFNKINQNIISLKLLLIERMFKEIAQKWNLCKLIVLWTISNEVLPEVVPIIKWLILQI